MPEWLHHNRDIVERSLSVYLELMSIVGAYRDGLVLVGGWAPFFILKRFGRRDVDFRHVGSVDIDLAVDQRRVSADQYASILERLTRQGYEQRKDRTGNPIPFSFVRNVSGDQELIQPITIDFLAGEYGGTGKRRRHQRVQPDLLAGKARGCDVVYDHWFWERLSGVLPNGAQNSVRIKVADLVGCLTMKGIVLGERLHAKDAYDIYSVLAYYSGGPAGAAQVLQPHLGNGLVMEAIDVIAEKFKSIRSVGPVGVAEFLGRDTQEAERVMADAFVSVRQFMNVLQT